MAGERIKPVWKPSRIKLIIELLLALGLPALLYYGINKWISHRERAFEREANQSLRDLAMAQEECFIENDSFAENIAVDFRIIWPQKI